MFYDHPAANVNESLTLVVAIEDCQIQLSHRLRNCLFDISPHRPIIKCALDVIFMKIDNIRWIAKASHMTKCLGEYTDIVRRFYACEVIAWCQGESPCKDPCDSTRIPGVELLHVLGV